MPENKDFKLFEERMNSAYRHLESAGVHFFDFRDPERHPEIPAALKK